MFGISGSSKNTLEEAKAAFENKGDLEQKPKKKPQIKEDWKALKTWRGHRGCK